MNSSLWLIKELLSCHTSTLGKKKLKLSFLFHCSLQCLLFNTPLWLHSYGSCFDYYSCELYPSLCRGVLYITLCDKVCQWHAADRWFYPGSAIKLVFFFISESKETSYTCFEKLYHLPINLIYCLSSWYEGKTLNFEMNL